MSTRARSAKRKDVYDHGISTAIGRTNSLRNSRARNLAFKQSKNTTGTAAYTPKRNNETAPGRHSCVNQSGIYPMSGARNHTWHSRTSTAISTTKAHLAQPAMMCVCPHCGIINRQRENKYDSSPISTTISKARALLDHTGVSTRAVYQPRSAERKYIWHNCVSTVRCITRDQPSESILAQLYINSSKQNKATALLSDTAVTARAVCSPRREKRRHIYIVDMSSTRYIDRDQQKKNASGAAVYQHRGISTAICEAK